MTELEPLLDPANERLTIFPIKYHSVWEMYKLMLEAFWKAEEIDFSSDYDDFQSFDQDTQHCIKMILAFFASSDGIVNFNLRERFSKEIKITEAQVAYGFQMMMENIHGEVYSLMLQNIVKDPIERDKLFNSIKTVPCVKLMADWAFKWIESTENFAHRLIAFAAIEGIFFSGAFATIFWLKKYRSSGKNIMNGLVESNRFISRDEGMHVMFACLLYSLIVKRVDKDVVNHIINDAVQISKLFNKDTIKCQMIGMNLELMNEYVEYIADTLLIMLGYEKLYNTDNPFPFMESIGLLNKVNLHENRPTEYKTAHTSKNIARNTINILKDF